MKRFLIATALTASLSTAAFAATPAQQAQINEFLPSVDVSMLTDAQVDTAMTIITSSESRANKIGKLQSIVAGIDYTPSSLTISEAEKVMLEEAAPGVDLATVSPAQVETALTLLNSSDGGNTDARVRAVLMNNMEPMGTTNTATEAETVILQRYLPDLDVAALTEAQLNSALSIVYSTDGESDIANKLKALLDA